MLCAECGEREATVAWVTAPRAVRDGAAGAAPAAGDPPPPPAPYGPAPAASPGPQLCEACARRRYEALRSAGAPGWGEMVERARRLRGDG
jgi:hypothetical protein